MLKRAYIQIPYAELSKLLFGDSGIAIFRVEKDVPGPNGYIEFIAYGSHNSNIERGATYRLEVGNKVKKLHD
jgi:hypothetical protein